MRTRLALLAALVVARRRSRWRPRRGSSSTGLGAGAEDRRDRRQQLGAEHAVPRRVPDPVTRTGVSLYLASNRPGGKGLLDIWVARRPNRARPVGRAREPRRAGQLGRRRLLSDAGPAAAACSSSAARRSRAAAGWATSTSPATAGKHGWSEPQHLACAPDGPNSALDEQGPSYVEAGTRRRRCTSRAARATVPGRHLRQRGLRRAGLRPGRGGRRVERPAGERHPAERAEGRARGRLLLEPRGHARRPGHLGRDAAKRPRPVVAPGQPRRGGEHGGGRVASLALAERAAAPLRARARPRGHWRHLRDDADDDRPQAPLSIPDFGSS